MRVLTVLAILLAAGVAGCVDSEVPEELVDTDGDGIPDTPKSKIAPVVKQLPNLGFLPPVDLVCPDYPNYQQGCGQFGEPTLEVAGDGTIWYSAVCCVGQSPPIWTSRDGGLTFQALPLADGTGVVRDASGIEGDFAIDDFGNVYFFDIMAATAYFTKYQADGTHVHTKPDVFQPLVDRPWVRAGVEDEVWIFYNTGSSTVLHHSADGGLTWNFPGGTMFPCALMTFGQGPNRNDLVVSGCPGDPGAWISHDGGVTFTDRIALPVPENTQATESYMQPAMDDAGNAYVPVTHVNLIGQETHTVISVYRISPGGNVSEPMTVTPPNGLVDKPWLVAAKEGVVAMAYYGAEAVGRANETDAEWYLKIAYTTDATVAFPTWTEVVADPKPVLTGTFGRSLGDFLELRQTPEGRLVVAYAAREAGGLQNKFVQSDLTVDFAPAAFRNGPQP